MKVFTYKMGVILRTLIVINLICSFAQLGAEEISQTKHVLKVGIKESPPFTIKNLSGDWSGLSADLWVSVAQKQKLVFEWVELPLNEILRRLNDGTLDVGVGALTMTTEREELLDFTHPIYSDGLAIAVRQEEGNIMLELLKRFMSAQFLAAVSALLGLLLVFGLLIWLLERKKNPDQFGGSVISGIGNGLWWSAVTMTTVGYGDKSPTTFFGRTLGLIWMFASIIVISSFTASIASSLTVQSFKYSVNSASDLNSAKCGSVKGTTGDEYLKAIHAKNTTYPHIDDALQALENREVDAIVYDRPILLHGISVSKDRDIKVLKDKINQEIYAFALPSNSPHREAINRSILRHLDGEDWSNVLDKYLGYDR
jgi:ABC-type amino acid transport substrate-binding protein